MGWDTKIVRGRKTREQLGREDYEGKAQQNACWWHARKEKMQPAAVAFLPVKASECECSHVADSTLLVATGPAVSEERDSTFARASPRGTVHGVTTSPHLLNKF